MEIVDIIDEQNNVLYQATKEEAHQKGLLHRTVIAEVRDTQGRMLLIRHATHKQDAGKYVSPMGGHVKAGESEEQALKREVREEIGLEENIYTFSLIGRAVYNRFVLGRQENHLYVVYEITTDRDLVLNEESLDYRRFTEDEVRQKLRDTPDIFGGAFHFVVKSFYPELLK